MKKTAIIFALSLIVLLISCQTVSLPAPTAEEAAEYEDTLQEVLTAAGFGGVANAISGNSTNGEYSAGDKLGVYEVTEDGHVRINIDLSNMLSGGTSVTYDIDIAYKPLFSDEKSIVYVAKTVPGEDGNVTTISKAELNGKAFDPEAMQQMLSK